MKFIIVLSLVAIVLSDDSTDNILREKNDVFTGKLFAEVVASNPGQSVVLSAFSVLSPLAQLSFASVGAAHDEVLKTIGFSNDNMTKVVFADANKKLRNVEGVEMKQANRIYVRSGAELKEEFAAVSRDVFDSDVKNVDFTKNVEAAKEINTWVEDHTNKQIKDLVDPKSLTVDTAIVLVNAIYFKLLEMQYLGEQSSLLIVLPNEIDGLGTLVEKFRDSSLLLKAIEEMSAFKVEVSLPRFKIETTTNLKDVLKKMGVNKIFTPGQAQLDNMMKDTGDIHVSEAVQKAFIEVNEKGTEAAAANLFIGVTRSARVYDRKQFNANRPFYYSLKQNGLILFSGVLYF